MPLDVSEHMCTPSTNTKLTAPGGSMFVAVTLTGGRQGNSGSGGGSSGGYVVGVRLVRPAGLKEVRAMMAPPVSLQAAVARVRQQVSVS
jgi:hypothetical protein